MKSLLYRLFILLCFSFLPLKVVAATLPLVSALAELSCNNNFSPLAPSQEELLVLVDDLFGLLQRKHLSVSEPEITQIYEQIFLITQKVLKEKKVGFRLEERTLRILPKKDGEPLAHFAFRLEEEGLSLVYAPEKTKEGYFKPYLEDLMNFENQVDHILSQKIIYLDNETIATGAPGRLMTEILDYMTKMKLAQGEKEQYLYPHAQLPEGLSLKIYENYNSIVPTAKYNSFGMFYERNLLESIVNRLGTYGGAETFSSANGSQGTVTFNQETWFRGVFSNESFSNEGNLNFLKTIFFSSLLHPEIGEKIIRTPVIGAYSSEMKASFFVSPGLMKIDDKIPLALKNLPDDYLDFIMGHYQSKLGISSIQVNELRALSDSMKNRSHFLVFSHDPWVKETGIYEFSPIWRTNEMEKVNIYGGAVSVVSSNSVEKLPLEILNEVQLERKEGELIAEIGRLGFVQNEEKTLHVAQALALYLKAEGVTKIYIEADRARTILFRRFGFKIHSKITKQVEFYPSQEANILSASIDDFLKASH
ncbi:MAG: hypothetical protein ACOYL6_18150 [Bacteriovoracaceae bacterium]